MSQVAILSNYELKTTEAIRAEIFKPIYQPDFVLWCVFLKDQPSSTIRSWRQHFSHFLLTYDVTQLAPACTAACAPAQPSRLLLWNGLNRQRVVFYCQIRSSAKFPTVNFQVGLLYNELNHLSFQPYHMNLKIAYMWVK